MEVLPPVFGRLKHGRSGPARTACVVAENRRIRPGRRSGPPPGIRPKLEEERERNETDSQKERVCRLLEGGDGAVGLGKRGLEVVENLRVGRPRGRTSRPFRRRPIGRRTATQQCCADRTLIPSKPRPDPPEGPVAPGTVGLADRRCDAAGDGALEEPPNGAGRQAQPADFLCEPDTDGPTAAAPAMAVAAEDAPGPDGPPWTAVIESGEDSMPDERADRPAVRARRPLEPLDHRGPLCFVPVEPPLAAHDRTPSKASERTENPAGGKSSGVR